MKPSSAIPWVILIILVIGLSAYVAVQRSPAPSPGVQTVTTMQTAAGIQKVDLIVDFVPVGIYAQFYAGVDHGFFAKSGLDVNVLPNPQGSAGAIRALADHKVDFAEADVGTLITLMAKEHITNVRAVALYYSTSPLAILYLQGKGKPVLKGPSDLEGKTLGAAQGSAIATVFPVFAKLNGVNTSRVNIVYVSSSILNNALLTGRFDGIMVFPRAKADLADTAAKQGFNVSVMRYADYGLNIYANMILTRTDIIEKNPDLVKRFLQGYAEAQQYAAANPREAVASILKFNPQMNANITYGEWLITMDYMGGRSTIANSKNPLTLFLINPDKMQQTIRTISSAYNVIAPEPASVYANQFIQSAG